MDLLCHPCITTGNLSYRLPILKLSQRAVLAGNSESWYMLWCCNVCSSWYLLIVNVCTCLRALAILQAVASCISPGDHGSTFAGWVMQLHWCLTIGISIRIHHSTNLNYTDTVYLVYCVLQDVQKAHASQQHPRYCHRFHPRCYMFVPVWWREQPPQA